MYLENDFKEKLFPDQAMLNRLPTGNYDNPEDVHKRPMAKYCKTVGIDLKGVQI